MSYINGPGRHGPAPYRRSSFSLAVIVGNPFTLSTISVAVICWIIALGGSIAADVSGKFPPFTWWGIVFQFLVIVGVIYAVGCSVLELYRVPLVAYLAVATVYTTNSTNNFVWNSTGADAAVAAGHILLSIINILWILYFGTTAEDVWLHGVVDSFAVYNAPSRGTSSFMPTHNNPFSDRDPGIGMDYRGAKTNSGDHPPMFTSAQLGGAFENTTADNGEGRESQQSPFRPASEAGQSDILTAPSEYPYRAKALYSYQASPDDANEISFEKGEILEVSDITGRWWQARRENGEVGICPSNYVQLER
uniref:High osmolarity signaling protein SHO1 n=1 Tax=Blastobotrys adeninivorans TaxID=409370 RepID=A0A060T6S2_BLAAD